MCTGWDRFPNYDDYFHILFLHASLSYGRLGHYLVSCCFLQWSRGIHINIHLDTHLVFVLAGIAYKFEWLSSCDFLSFSIFMWPVETYLATYCRLHWSQGNSYKYKSHISHRLLYPLRTGISHWLNLNSLILFIWFTFCSNLVGFFTLGSINVNYWCWLNDSSHYIALCFRLMWLFHSSLVVNLEIHSGFF